MEGSPLGRVGALVTWPFATALRGLHGLLRPDSAVLEHYRPPSPDMDREEPAKPSVSLEDLLEAEFRERQQLAATTVSVDLSDYSAQFREEEEAAQNEEAEEKKEKENEVRSSRWARFAHLLRSAWNAHLGALGAFSLAGALLRLKGAHDRWQCWLALHLCSRLSRLIAIGWMTMIWGILLTGASLCVVVLSFSEDIGDLLNVSEKKFARFLIYVLAYLCCVHIAQGSSGILLLFACKLAQIPEPHEVTLREFLMCAISTFGIIVSAGSLTSAAEREVSRTPEPLLQSLDSSEAVLSEVVRKSEFERATSSTADHLELNSPLLARNAAASKDGPSIGGKVGGTTLSSVNSQPIPDLAQNPGSANSQPNTSGHAAVAARSGVNYPLEPVVQISERPEASSMHSLPNLTSPVLLFAPSMASRTSESSVAPRDDRGGRRQSLPSSPLQPVDVEGWPALRPQSKGDMTSSVTLDDTGKSLQSIFEEEPREGATAQQRAPGPGTSTPRLVVPWLWTAALSLFTYTAAMMVLLFDGHVISALIAATTIVLAVPCVSDVLAEWLGIPEVDECRDFEVLFEDTSFIIESIEMHALPKELRQGSRAFRYEAVTQTHALTATEIETLAATFSRMPRRQEASAIIDESTALLHH